MPRSILATAVVAAAVFGFRAWGTPPAAPSRPLTDPASRAAIACGEPPLQLIFDRQGYTVNTLAGEVNAQRFVLAGRGPVTFRPIAAYGLPKVCSAGWYAASDAGTADPSTGRVHSAGTGVGQSAVGDGAGPVAPELHRTWQVGANHNKQEYPPIMRGGQIRFDPGRQPFGLWVSTAGFSGETIYTEDALQALDQRFSPTDRHKAHVFPVRRGGRLVPHAYLIGWEYSTNNDDQDMVTLVTGVDPAKSP